ncbi:hypothetical protein MAPG_07735 [Magnaporthiopsis poae ATCC 64411]|uniref:Rho-GAP domain-containing protein n=1 Tax=Magnaporthiopsis poae (strain ATCC 64411 / 73-15) TaxID=644358 RepID=A0A0C4E5G9_MAGP6|nr:hypothetical protein MAPG_07735 [Magnaporthiopsis poae ATCC 64411]
MDSSKPAIPVRAPGRLPPSLTFAALQSAPASSSSSRRRERSSNTWTSSSADMALLSDTDEVEDRTWFVEEYNRLASKYGIRPLAPEDFDDAPSVVEVAPPGKKKWFSRKRDASGSRTTSGKSDKTLGHKASIGDLHLNLGVQGKRDSPKDKSLQTLVKLCGKSFLYLPTEYTPGCLVVPTCLRATGQYLAQNGPQEKGLFRVPGSVRAVNALYDYYCADYDGGGTISGTVRTPNLPSHLDFGVHDVASTFKRLLAGLPGGILGSVSVFDALVAIRGQLDGGLETNRTRQTRLRARLIALAIATLRSHYQRELVCAVFGLLCLVGRAAETAPREDDYGRPLPTSDLMGYNALGIIFGPLLLGGLIDHWSTHATAPSAGPMHLHPPLPPPRKDRSKRRAFSDGKRPATPVTVDKILIANSIAEMVIANWRDVVRHLKSASSTIHNDPALALPREAPMRSLRTSASESALGTLRRRTRLEKSDGSQDTPSEDLTIKKQRMKSSPGMVPFARRTSPRLASTTEEAVTDRAARVDSAAADEQGSKKQNGDLDVAESTSHTDGHITIGSTPYMDLADPHLGTAAAEPVQNIKFPSLFSNDRQPIAHQCALSGEQGQQSEEASKTDDTATNVGILVKAHRALKAKLAGAAHRGSRSITPHSSGIATKEESSCSTDGTLTKTSALEEPALNEGPLLGQSSLPVSRRFTTTVRRAPRTSEAAASPADADANGIRACQQHSSTRVSKSTSETQADDQAARDMGRKNAVRQQHRSRQSTGIVSKKAELGEDVPETQPSAPPIVELEEERLNLDRIPRFHIEEQDVAALRERGSPTRFHADTTVRMGRKLYTGCSVDEYHPYKNRENRLEPHGVTSETLTSTVQTTHNPWHDGETEALGRQDQPLGQVVGHSNMANGKPAMDYATVAPQIREPATPRQSLMASSPGSAMLRTRASVSGGNVRAMAALFESVAKESRGGPSPPVQGNGGGGALMTEYVTNATPPRTSRSSKSLRAGEISFSTGLYGGRTTGGGPGGQDGAGSEHDAHATKTIEEQSQKTQPSSQPAKKDSAAGSGGASIVRARTTPGTVVTASMPVTEDAPMAQCLRKSQSRASLGGEARRSRSRSPGTCLLHAQIRSLKMQLAAKVDESPLPL